MTEELTQMIDKLVQERTFSLEAVGNVKHLRDRADLLQKQLDQMNKDSSKKSEQIEDLRKQLAVFEQERNIVKSREDAVFKRETEITNLEKTTAVSNAKFFVLQQVFDKMFANRQLRESIVDSVPVPVNNGGYTNVQYHNQGKNTVKEEA